MKKQYAFWEERNLSKRTATFDISRNEKDSVDNVVTEIDEFCESNKIEYAIVKIDSRRPEYMLAIQKNGFQYMESQIDLILTREMAHNILKKLSVVYNDLVYMRCDDLQKKLVINEVNKGIFKIDRVAIDPIFGIKIANRRYAFWIEDAVQNNGKLYLIKYKNNPVGFFLDDDSNKKCLQQLPGGMFISSQNEGQGAMLLYATIKSFVEGECKKAVTAVLSSNISSLKLHLEFGYKIKGIRYVLVKHTN